MADASSGEDDDFRPGTESDDDDQSWNESGASQDGGGDGAGGGSGDDGSDDNGSEGGIASDAADAGSESDGGGDATESGGGAGGGGGAQPQQQGRNGTGRQHAGSPQRTRVRSARDAPVAAVRTRGGVGVQDSKGDEAGSDGDGDGDDGDADMSGGESSVSEQPTPPRPRADLRATEEDEVSDLDDEDEDDGSGHEGPDNRRSQYFPLGQIPQAAIAGVAAVVGRAQVYHDQTYVAWSRTAACVGVVALVGVARAPLAPRARDTGSVVRLRPREPVTNLTKHGATFRLR